MKRFHIVLTAILLLSMVLCAGAQNHRIRTEIRIPDIPGYMTLLADLHTHTVLSDGLVHPVVRPEEAWREGFDILSITDHIEYQPNREWIPPNHNIGHDIASGRAKELGILLIRGSEITRDLPLGHYNAIFLTDNKQLDKEDALSAFEAAAEQGAFIFWNHPGWPRPGRVPVWTEEQQKLYELGYLHGIEVVNTREYYPLAHKWAIEKKLTMIGNSDVHAPADFDYHYREGDHRALTLIFAEERTQEAVREALDARRTAVYHGGLLIGDEQYLKPIFYNSIELVNPELEIAGDGWAKLQVTNNSDIDYILKAQPGKEDTFSYSGEITLKAHHTVLIHVAARREKGMGTVEIALNYLVTNLYVEPGKGMQVSLPVTIHHSDK